MQKKIYVIAHNVRSLHNIGSLFRSADAFGVAKIFLSGYTPGPEKIIRENGEICRQKKQIAKTALGAEECVPWVRKRSIISLIGQLKKQGVKIYALETGMKNLNIYQFRPDFPCAVLIGNEKEGLERKILAKADAVVAIPMRGKKTSLNVAVAAGVALFALNFFSEQN